jgi:hypothetical protein
MILALSMAVIAATVFLLLPAVIRQVLEWKISEAVHRRIAIRKVYFTPLRSNSRCGGDGQPAGFFRYHAVL